MRSLLACTLATLAALVLAPAGRGDTDRLREDFAGLEAGVFDAVNEHRIAIGQAPLEHDAALSGMARDHSEDMAAGRSGFGHDGFAGRRDAAAGLGPFTRIAENVSRHRRDLETIPDAALRAWLASPSHRKNLEGDYRLSGVAAARAPDGTVYITQLFLLR